MGIINKAELQNAFAAIFEEHGFDNKMWFRVTPEVGRITVFDLRIPADICEIYYQSHRYLVAEHEEYISVIEKMQAVLDGLIDKFNEEDEYESGYNPK